MRHLWPGLLVCWVAACSADPQGACRVTPVQTVALDQRSNMLVAPIRIDGQDVPGILDTGAERSAVTDAVVTRLGLLADPRHGTLMTGVGGQGIGQSDALVAHYAFGGYDLGPGHFAVIGLPFAGHASDAPGALVGADLLSHFDLDLDVAHKRLVLYDVHGCHGDFLPWTVPYVSVPLEETWGGRLRLPVKVDGHEMTAMLDTGSSSTMLDEPAAARIGVTPAMLAADVGGEGFGAAGVNFRQVAHRFATLQVGADVFAAPRLTVLDRSLGETDMLLGLTYLGARHVWISYRTHRLFIATPQ